jgi:hypothetical protein
MADGSGVSTPVFRSHVRIGDLVPIDASVIILGDEPLVGRGITDALPRV